ncbi:MAG: lipid A biosynthesis lauroyl acyltransferase [Gammaproteobacteria bacterium]|nr:lipid A biosynthesis lauroyl acyltransferase [Gammaproteobacteria bacterium]
MKPQQAQPFHPWQPKYWLPWLLVALLFLLCQLPYRLQLWLGSGLGKLIYLFARRERRIAATNIALCFPEKSPKQQKRMLKQHFSSLGISVFEMGLARWSSRKRLLHLSHSEGRDHLDEAIKKGRGIMLLAPHFTCIQICARILSLSYPVSILYRPHKNPFVNHFFEKIYSQSNGIIPRHNIRLLLRTLKKEKGIICFTPDVDTGGKTRVFVPFFGIATATTTIPAVMGRIASATSIAVHCHRLPHGKGYKFYINKPLENFPSADIEKDISIINQATEASIRQCPEQYLWVYKRFKSRPKGEKRFY